MVRWGSGSKPPLDPPRCPPAAEYFYIWKRRRPSRQLSSGRVWSTVVATIRERTRERRRVGEE
ncbi:hypothetical protein T07_192 [Trichinella nelsoni]|uniref:Uncharacterized protein n=1 Tax=Trichinella nelsoni TaxID=6336 RepID=A0A0V0RBR4_9BILA|nr:hypothetical protein T07_192 [Trichinella nelsoni]